MSIPPCWALWVSESLREGVYKHWSEGRAGDPLTITRARDPQHLGWVWKTYWWESVEAYEEVSRRTMEILFVSRLIVETKNSALVSLVRIFLQYIHFQKGLYKRGCCCKRSQVHFLQHWPPKYTCNHLLLCFHRFHRIWHSQLLQQTENPKCF